jgi:type I restriction enzyme S subunit
MSTISKHHQIKLSIDKLPNWDLRKISEVCQVLDDHRKPLNETQRNLIPGEIPYCGANGIVGFVNQYTIDDDVILMAEDGGYFDEYQSRPIAYRMKGKIWVNNHAHILKAFPSVNQDFIFYSLAHKNILEYVNGGTRAKLNKGELVNIPLAIPPLEEQKAIAQVLSDFDNLIDGLERLIAKKRSIREGLMQELLRPKEGWELIKIRDIGETYGGLMGKSKKDFKSGNALYITFMNVMQHPIVNKDKLENVSVSTNEKQNLVQKGDLLFNGSSETPEEIGMCSLLNQEVPLLYLNSFCFGFRLKSPDRVYPLFLTYYFRSGHGRQLLYSSAQGATRYNLSKKNFNDLIFPIPPINSQQDIARTIYDLDAELNLIEISIKKWKSIREGVMNQLLTGKIRLV